MRGFDTLLAASVAVAGVTQIAVLVARGSHSVDPVPVEQPASDCCQYRTWPVENSFWTFPFQSEFHGTARTPLDEGAPLGPFSRPTSDDGEATAGSIHPSAGRESRSQDAARFFWNDFVNNSTTPAADSAEQAQQNTPVPQWATDVSATRSHTQTLASGPTLTLFLADPGSAGDPAQTPDPSSFDALTPPPPPATPPPPPDLGNWPSPPVVGGPGGGGGDPSGGTPLPADVPEPAALVVVLTALLGLAAARRPRRA